MHEYARVDILADHEGSPVVKLNALPGFTDLTPMTQAIMLNAAIQLCAAGVREILNKNPDESGEIVEQLAQMALHVDHRKPN